MKYPVRDWLMVASDPRPAILEVRRRGRPRIGEARDKPWEALGMSQRTWQRRQKEKAGQ